MITCWTCGGPHRAASNLDSHGAAPSARNAFPSYQPICRPRSRRKDKDFEETLAIHRLNSRSNLGVTNSAPASPLGLAHRQRNPLGRAQGSTRIMCASARRAV